MSGPIPDPTLVTPDPMPLITNDPNPLMIAIYAGGLLIAVVWNLVAYYKLFTFEHVKRELEIKRKLRILGWLDPEDK